MEGGRRAGRRASWRGGAVTGIGDPIPLHVLLAAMTDPTVLLEPVRSDSGELVDFAFAAVNPAFDRFLGVPEGGSVGRTLAPVQEDAGTRRFFDLYAEVLATGAPLSLDNVPRLEPRTGALRHYDLRASRVGPYVGVTFRDVTPYVEATEALRESEERYRIVAENAGDLVFRSELGRLTWVSPSSSRVLGLSPEELVGRSGRDLVVPDDLTLLDGIGAELDRAGRAAYTARFRHADGGVRHLSVSLTAVVDHDGSHVAETGSARDVTAEMLARGELARSEDLFRTAMQSASMGMGIHDSAGVFVAVNPALCAILGRHADELVGTSMLAHVHPDDVAQVRAAGPTLRAEAGARAVVEVRLMARDGTPVWVRASGALMPRRDDEAPRLITHIIDITVERRQRMELEDRALHDQLTGLYNRAWILDTLDNELRRIALTGATVAVLNVDLDNFRVINDSLGHGAGDDVLCEVARRIAATLRPRDYAARLGGDEFLVVATEIHGPADAEFLAARIARTLTETVHVDDRSLVVGASVGVALSQPGSTAASLLRDADSALFRAKASGRSQWQFFDQTMHSAALARLTTESELRDGLAQRQFVPWFQPIVSLDPLRITGYEALVRWQHPERGVVPPDDFLPVAEESGLFVELGASVLDSVCALLASRPDLPGTISVNKSPTQINRARWHDHFVEALQRHRVDPRRIVIEVTESAVLANIDRVADDLRRVRSLGVGLHIDDFGTGYSSLALLRDLPVTGIKLDRSFTQHLMTDKQSRVVAAGLASLADGLDLVSIAEGIEEPDQAAELADLGWTHGQGYLFGRPAPDPLVELA